MPETIHATVFLWATGGCRIQVSTTNPRRRVGVMPSVVGAFSVARRARKG